MDFIKNHPGKENKRASPYSEQQAGTGSSDRQKRHEVVKTNKRRRINRQDQNNEAKLHKAKGLVIIIAAMLEQNFAKTVCLGYFFIVWVIVKK